MFLVHYPLKYIVVKLLWPSGTKVELPSSLGSSSSSSSSSSSRSSK